MMRFAEREQRSQTVLFPERLEDWISEENPVRVVDVFVDELDLKALGFERATAAQSGRPRHHPPTPLKIYVYGYLNRIASSRQLEREAQRNVELMWLRRRLPPDFRTIADVRRDSGLAIRRVCAQFVVFCKRMNLFFEAIVAIDASKFKAVNKRDKNFTKHKLKARMAQLDQTVARYLEELDRAGRQPTQVPKVRVDNPKGKIAKIREQMRELGKIEEGSRTPRTSRSRRRTLMPDRWQQVAGARKRWLQRADGRGHERAILSAFAHDLGRDATC